MSEVDVGAGGVNLDDEGDDVLAADTWILGRSGARAGRGFHFQDVVGAWLVAGQLAGELAIDRVVPEGYEDLSCEGTPGWQIQVKSRQERVGNFSVNETAEHLADMWDKRQSRSAPGTEAERLVLVLERPVNGFIFSDWASPINALPDGNGLGAALARVAVDRGWAEGAVSKLSEVASVFSMTWEQCSAQTRHWISKALNTYPLVADTVGRALRDGIAECSDLNASAPTPLESCGIDRSRAFRIANDVLALVDLEGLEEALASGICEVVSFETPTEQENYFEGSAAQPWHVAAGLPAPRPDLVTRVAEGLDREDAVLIAGPSGIGKSTVMWATVYAMRHVLWYRVRRLDADSVEKLMRLARASRPSSRSQVGFVVDGVGIGVASAWDQLQRSIAAAPGVMLLGSVRTEDLFPLHTLPDCVTVTVAMDEEVAERIFRRLQASGLSRSAHWREAYVAADGLTLEYTYLLTQGRRLVDVLEDQVKRRVAERREAELEVLALVTTAHRWDGSLEVDTLQRLMGVGRSDLRIALARLNDEHLLRTSNEKVSGLHALRSRFLSESVHSYPPPTLSDTVKRLVAASAPDHIGSLVVGALTDHPELEEDVVASALARIREDGHPAVLSATLDALRQVDFRRRSRAWPEIMERHHVDPPLRHIAFELALVGGTTGLDLKPGMAEAIHEIGRSLDDTSPLHRRLVDDIGLVAIAGTLAGCSDATVAIAVLSALSGTDLTGTELSMDQWRSSNLGSLLREVPATEFGDLVEAARLRSPELAGLFFELGGGEQGVIAKLMQHSPWITDLRIVDVGESPTPQVRTLHISDEVQGDPDESNRALARIVLRCFPRCEGVDVQALLAGGLPIRVGSNEFAVSHLRRQYDHSEAEVSWNRRRMAMAIAAFGTAQRTERVALANRVIPQLARFLDDLARVWIVSRNRAADATRLEQQRSSLRELKSLIVPRGVSSTSGIEAAALGSDYLHSLIEAVIENLGPRLTEPGGNRASLAAFTGASLRDYVAKVAANEEWDLLDLEPPAELVAIDETLVDLHAVLSELAHGTTTSQDLSTAARSGPSASALRRAAQVALRNAQRRHDRHWQATLEKLNGAGVSAAVHKRQRVRPAATEWPPIEVAISVDSASIQAWNSDAERLIELIGPTGYEGSYHPALLIVPCFEGRPLKQMALQMISSVLPGVELFATWASDFPRYHDTPIAEAMIQAHSALQLLSGIAVLATFRETADLQGVADNAGERFQASYQAIAAVEPQDEVTDAVLEFLADLATQVQGELDDTQEGRPLVAPLAESISRGASAALGGGATGGEEPFVIYNVVLGICLQADVNREVALSLLA